MSDTFEFLDILQAPEASSRSVTRDGYLIAPAILAKAGVFSYRAEELGLTDRKPGEMVSVYRSPETLEKSIEGFEAQTITLDHRWTNSANWRQNAIGDVHDIEMQADDMVGTLIVRDAKGIKAIEAGKKQLSNGYKASVVKQPGTYKGQSYEYEQVNLVGNHIALVDAARCGSTCQIADSEPAQKELFMVTRIYDGLTISLESEHSAQVFDKMAKKLETLEGEVPKVYVGDKALTGEEVKTLLDCKCQEIDALKKQALSEDDIQKMVVERSKVMSEAREMVPDLKIGDKATSHDIRMEALHTLTLKDESAREMWNGAFGDRKPESIKPEEVAIAFSTIVAGMRRAKEARKVSDSRFQVGRVADAVASQREEKDARQLYIERTSQTHRPTRKEVN